MIARDRELKVARARAGPGARPGAGRHLLDGHHVQAERLDHGKELVQLFVLVHEAGDHRLSGHLGDLHVGEGVPCTLGQTSRDPDLVAPIRHGRPPSHGAGASLAAWSQLRVGTAGPPHPAQMNATGR
jgi:hypothetical protein